MQSSDGIAIERTASGWKLSCEQRVGRPIADVFPFFAAARNLERLTPPFLRFRIRRISSEPLAAGATIDYVLRLRHVPIRWRTRIDEWRPPHRFVDRQVRGPFRVWRHTHAFRAAGGGTVIADTVRFDLYCRPLARTPILGWVNADLRAIFAYRRREIARVFARRADGPARR